METTAPSSKRLPPYSLEAERAVLGGILLHNELINSVSELIKPEDFYSELHQILFEGMIVLTEQNTGLDFVTIKNYLQKTGKITMLDGMQSVVDLCESTSSASNVTYHATIIKDKSMLRRLIHKAEEIIARAYQAEGEVRDIVDDAEASIFEIAQVSESEGPRHIEDILHGTFDDLERLSKTPQLVTGIPSGFQELDTLTSGFHSGELIIIAARPSIGKTTFAMNIVHNICNQEKKPCLVFSLEMTKEQLAQRLLCAEAEVESQKLRTGHIRGEDWSRLARAVTNLSHMPLYIDDTPAISIIEMRARARRLKSKVGLGLIMIDYLQLMQGRRKFESRQIEISEISRSLKFMAKEMACPVIALSQLSRAVEMTRDFRPQLAHLRESGAIEQDADLVLLLYRPEKHGIKEIEIRGRKQNSEGLAEVIIAKQRNGPPGSVFLAFREKLMQFMEPILDYETPPDVPYPEDDYEEGF